ncbi:MAG: phosphate starvation-inducible protein PhoH, partial [Pseudomonadota bacterium]
MTDVEPVVTDETLIEFADNRILAELCGQFDRNLTRLEQGFDVAILRRGNRITLQGPPDARAVARSALTS